MLASPEMLRAPIESRREHLARVVDAGGSHVFVADHVSFHVGVGMDGLVQAALIAGLEPRLDVVVGVYLLALRHPVPVARQIATLCESIKKAAARHNADTGRFAHEYTGASYVAAGHHELSMQQSYSGWTGPYIEEPLHLQHNRVFHADHQPTPVSLGQGQLVFPIPCPRRRRFEERRRPVLTVQDSCLRNGYHGWGGAGGRRSQRGHHRARWVAHHDDVILAVARDATTHRIDSQGNQIGLRSHQRSLSGFESRERRSEQIGRPLWVLCPG